jgi:hypothetical protein
MESENLKISNLLQTVTELTACLQTSGEVDFYFFYRAHKIVETLEVKDFEYLKFQD